VKLLLQNVVANSGLTDKELAKLIKVSVPTVNRWRTGKNSPHELMIPNLIKNIRSLVRPTEFVIERNLTIANRDPELILLRPSWAVIYRGNCIDRTLEIVWEPQPSSRDDEFYASCRFTFEEAKEVAKRWTE